MGETKRRQRPKGLTECTCGSPLLMFCHCGYGLMLIAAVARRTSELELIEEWQARRARSGDKEHVYFKATLDADPQPAEAGGEE